MTIGSQAYVAATRPHRYAKQLAAHLGRRIETTWDEESGHGRLVFPRGTGTGTMTAAPGAPLLTAESDAEHLAVLEDVIARHLVRFGTKDELLVQWQRDPAAAQAAPHQQTDTPTHHPLQYPRA